MKLKEDVLWVVRKPIPTPGPREGSLPSLKQQISLFGFRIPSHPHKAIKTPKVDLYRSGPLIVMWKLEQISGHQFLSKGSSKLTTWEQEHIFVSMTAFSKQSLFSEKRDGFTSSVPGLCRWAGAHICSACSVVPSRSHDCWTTPLSIERMGGQGPSDILTSL